MVKVQVRGIVCFFRSYLRILGGGKMAASNANRDENAAEMQEKMLELARKEYAELVQKKEAKNATAALRIAQAKLGEQVLGAMRERLGKALEAIDNGLAHEDVKVQLQAAEMLLSRFVPKIRMVDAEEDPNQLNAAGSGPAEQSAERRSAQAEVEGLIRERLRLVRGGEAGPEPESGG